VNCGAEIPDLPQRRRGAEEVMVWHVAMTGIFFKL